FSGTEAERVDAPSAYVTLTNGSENLGTYLVSLYLNGPQEVKVGDKAYLIELRFRRTYKPYSIQLLKFTHEKYTGTEVAKNFASRVRLIDPANHEDREVLIWMNHPLLYKGETLYQSGCKPSDQTT